MEYLDGSKKAPAKTIEVEKAAKTKEIIVNSAYTQWVAQDQAVLRYLLNSLSKEVLQHVLSKTTAFGVRTIETMFSSQSIAAYFSKMHALGDELAAAGKPLEDEELVSFIIAGLDADYNPLVSSIMTRTEPMSLSDLYAQIMCYDMRLEICLAPAMATNSNLWLM